MRAKRRNVCQICRSRKLACDGKQPACSQRILRCVPCSGYSQEFVFVSQAPWKVVNQANVEEKGKKLTACQYKALVKSKDNGVRPTRTTQLASYISKEAQSETTCFKLEDDLQIIVQHYAPANSNASAESDPLHNQICGAWAEILPLVSSGIRENQFLLSAVQTLATTLRHHQLGEELDQPQILEMYCASLGLMREALAEAQGTFHIEHGVAIMCLAVSDIMIPKLESTSRFGWMMHMQGVGDLAERLGPDPFSTGIMYKLFLGFRPLLLISSILQRRKTFLARVDWTTIPFCGRPISIMHLLLNDVSELPTLLERYDALVDLKNISNIVAVESLRKDFQKLLKSLQEWKLMVHSKVPPPLFWSKRDPRLLSLDGADVIWFPNIMIANSLTHCWAFEIIVKRHLSMLDGAFTTVEEDGHQASLPTLSDGTSQRTVTALAGMICDSMSYLMQPDMKLYGPGSAFFTLATAIQIFRRDPDHYSFQLSRCQQILNRLASMGFHFPNT